MVVLALILGSIWLIVAGYFLQQRRIQERQRQEVRSWPKVWGRVVHQRIKVRSADQGSTPEYANYVRYEYFWNGVLHTSNGLTPFYTKSRDEQDANRIKQQLDTAKEVGVGISGAGFWIVKTQGDYENWPTTAAAISVVEGPTIADGKADRLLQLTYDFEGKTYQRTFSFEQDYLFYDSDIPVRGLADLVPFVAMHKGKNKIEIFVNPKRPQDIHYHQYLPPRPYFMIVFGLVFSALPLLLGSVVFLDRSEPSLVLEYR